MLVLVLHDEAGDEGAGEERIVLVEAEAVDHLQGPLPDLTEVARAAAGPSRGRAGRSGRGWRKAS